MKTIKTLLCLVLVMSITKTNAQELKLNTKKSTIEWTGKAAFNAYSLTGTLEASEGIIIIENNQITGLHITINMKSLDHDNSDLKTHLRGKDFFEVNSYTKASFKITKHANIETNKIILIGNMTIKGITRQERITATLDNNILSFEHIMDRTSYGVKFNSPSFFKKMKENAIADDFILKGKLVF